MANTIQIKRGSGAPSSLADGELGFDKTNNILYIGNGSSVVAFNYVKKTGDTMTGNLTISPSAEGRIRVYDGTHGGSILFGFSTNHQTHGLYSYGYAPTSSTWTSDAKWILYRDSSGNVTLAGNATTATSATSATTATYPQGFSSRSTNATWGEQTGATVTAWNEADGGSIDFRKNNPSSGKLSIKVDGRLYFNEGNTPAGGLKSANNYWGMTDPDGSDSVWIRTTTQGLIPYQSGGVGSGHQSLGTSTWYFNHAYVSSVHGGSGEFTNGNVTITAGNLWAGTDGNTASERQVGVQSGSGRIYLYSQASTSGTRGIYLSAHGTDTSGKYLLRVDTNNNITYGGGTMSGVLTMLKDQYDDAYTGALNMNNSNIYGVNSIYTADVSNNAGEGINFYRDSTHVDTLWMNSGEIYFVPNRALGTGTTAANSQRVARFLYSSSAPTATTGLIWLKPI